MDWQILLTLGAIALAGAYLLARGWRALRGNAKGCTGGCGCVKTEAPPAVIPPEQLTLRRPAQSARRQPNGN